MFLLEIKESSFKSSSKENKYTKEFWKREERETHQPSKISIFKQKLYTYLSYFSLPKLNLPLSFSSSYVSHSKTSYTLSKLNRTTPILLVNKLLQKRKYEQALNSCQKYNLSKDIVHKKIWLDSPISQQNNSNLEKIEDKVWVLINCLTRNAETLEKQKLLLEYGESLCTMILSKIEKEREQQKKEIKIEEKVENKKEIYQLFYLLYFEVKERFESYLSIFDSNFNQRDFSKYKKISILDYSLEQASKENFYSLHFLFSCHSKQILPFFTLILENLPLVSPIEEYHSLLLSEKYKKQYLSPKKPNEFQYLLEPTHLIELLGISESERNKYLEFPFIFFKERISNKILSFLQLVDKELFTSFQLFHSSSHAHSSHIPQSYPLTHNQLYSFYKERAINIDKNSGQLDLSIALLTFAIEKENIKELESLKEDAVHLSNLVYFSSSFHSMELEQYSLLTIQQKISLFFENFEDDLSFIFFKSVKSLIKSSFIEQSSFENFEQYSLHLLKDFMLSHCSSEKGLKIIGNILKNSSQSSVENKIIEDKEKLYEIVLDAYFSSNFSENWLLFEDSLQYFPKGNRNTQISLRIKKFEELLTLSKILSKYSLAKPLCFFNNLTSNRSELFFLIQQFILFPLKISQSNNPTLSLSNLKSNSINNLFRNSLSYFFKNKDISSATQVNWREHYRDTLKIREMIGEQVMSESECTKIFTKVLLLSGEFELSSYYLEKLEEEQSLLILIECSNYFLSASQSSKDKFFSSAKKCLELSYLDRIDSPLLYSSRKLIEAVLLFEQNHFQISPFKLLENKSKIFREFLLFTEISKNLFSIQKLISLLSLNNEKNQLDLLLLEICTEKKDELSSYQVCSQLLSNLSKQKKHQFSKKNSFRQPDTETDQKIIEFSIQLVENSSSLDLNKKKNILYKLLNFFPSKNIDQIVQKISNLEAQQNIESISKNFPNRLSNQESSNSPSPTNNKISPSLLLKQNRPNIANSFQTLHSYLHSYSLSQLFESIDENFLKQSLFIEKSNFFAKKTSSSNFQSISLYFSLFNLLSRKINKKEQTEKENKFEISEQSELMKNMSEERIGEIMMKISFITLLEYRDIIFSLNCLINITKVSLLKEFFQQLIEISPSHSLKQKSYHLTLFSLSFLFSLQNCSTSSSFLKEKQSFFEKTSSLFHSFFADLSSSKTVSSSNKLSSDSYSQLNEQFNLKEEQSQCISYFLNGLNETEEHLRFSQIDTKFDKNLFSSDQNYRKQIVEESVKKEDYNSLSFLSQQMNNQEAGEKHRISFSVLRSLLKQFNENQESKTFSNLLFQIESFLSSFYIHSFPQLDNFIENHHKNFPENLCFPLSNPPKKEELSIDSSLDILLIKEANQLIEMQNKIGDSFVSNRNILLIFCILYDFFNQNSFKEQLSTIIESLFLLQQSKIDAIFFKDLFFSPKENLIVYFQQNLNKHSLFYFSKIISILHQKHPSHLLSFLSPTPEDLGNSLDQEHLIHLFFYFISSNLNNQNFSDFWELNKLDQVLFFFSRSSLDSILHLFFPSLFSFEEKQKRTSSSLSFLQKLKLEKQIEIKTFISSKIKAILEKESHEKESHENLIYKKIFKYCHFYQNFSEFYSKVEKKPPEIEKIFQIILENPPFLNKSTIKLQILNMTIKTYQFSKYISPIISLFKQFDFQSLLLEFFKQSLSSFHFLFSTSPFSLQNKQEFAVEKFEKTIDEREEKESGIENKEISKLFDLNQFIDFLEENFEQVGGKNEKEEILRDFIRSLYIPQTVGFDKSEGRKYFDIFFPFISLQFNLNQNQKLFKKLALINFENFSFQIRQAKHLYAHLQLVILSIISIFNHSDLKKYHPSLFLLLFQFLEESSSPLSSKKLLCEIFSLLFKYSTTLASPPTEKSVNDPFSLLQVRSKVEIIYFSLFSQSIMSSFRLFHSSQPSNQETIEQISLLNSLEKQTFFLSNNAFVSFQKNQLAPPTFYFLLQYFTYHHFCRLISSEKTKTIKEKTLESPFHSLWLLLLKELISKKEFHAMIDLFEESLSFFPPYFCLLKEEEELEIYKELESSQICQQNEITLFSILFRSQKFDSKINDYFLSLPETEQISNQILRIILSSHSHSPSLFTSQNKKVLFSFLSKKKSTPTEHSLFFQQKVSYSPFSYLQRLLKQGNYSQAIEIFFHFTNSPLIFQKSFDNSLFLLFSFLEQMKKMLVQKDQVTKDVYNIIFDQIFSNLEKIK